MSSTTTNISDLSEIDEESEMAFVPESQFQVQIFVSSQRPGLNNNRGATEIRVTGGVPRTRRLPPISNGSAGSNNQTSWSPSPRSDLSLSQTTTSRSRYHANCHSGPVPQLLYTSANARYRYHPRYIRAVDRPHMKNDTTVMANNAQLNQEEVANFLRTHPEFLQRHVIEEIELEQLERWIIRKSQRNKKKDMQKARKTSLSRWRFCVHADKRQMLQDLTQSLQQKPTKDHVLWELASCISSAVNADGFKLYIPDRGNPDVLVRYLGLHETDANESSMSNEKQDHRIYGTGSVPCYVARTREPVRLSKDIPDARFPDGISHEDGIYHMLCQAVMQPDGELAAVLELWKRDPNSPFFEEDEEIGTSYLVWGGIALHYAQLYLTMNKQRKLNDFLLAVVKSIFQDMVSMDMLVIKIMNFAQHLVDADRASLFLVDAKNKELYATIFDVGIEKEKIRNSADAAESVKINTSKEIRFPLGTGIAGQVAMTGEVLNISDAYADSRFNRAVDQITGYKTETILCMPIFIRGSIIGVVQMVNKRCGPFTQEDEEAFEMFAVYCGLALHHAKLYDKIRRSEQKYRVALEVLSYHNTCTDEEVDLALREGIPVQAIGVEDYYFNPFELDDYEKARHALYMFSDLFGLARFDKNNLIRFMLTVKKNYRRVPYHNWTHGFSVSHTMYTIIKKSENFFRPSETLALFIGALCHDLDHRGKNNKFMLLTESPLAAIYSTSTMEHHHFNQTVTILQQEGHNIFNKLSSCEYKQVLGLIKHCILATDLALFFPNKTRLLQLLKDGSFSWTNQDHRLLIIAVSMTGSDLSASAKPWDIQTETVKVIFEEFYQQGDAEKSAGLDPIPMMDRNQADQQASSQVGFLTGICLPCYNLLYKLLPDTKPLFDMCEENLRRWRKIDEELQAKKRASVDF